MNTAPHAHEIEITRTTSYWGITYGDQYDSWAKPVRFWWDSEVAYWKRCSRRLEQHVRTLVARHDRLTIKTAKQQETYASARVHRYDPPVLRLDQWGSEQLKK